jgi:hypothetical protein
MLYAAYERGGAGHGAVHRLLDVCWLKLPRIKKPESDEKSPWEVKTGKALRSIRAWSKLKDLDRRNLVGRYAAVIYRVADSKTLDQPLERATKLVDLIPLYENQIKVTKWHTDQDAENYGTPAMFQYRQISHLEQRRRAGLRSGPMFTPAACRSWPRAPWATSTMACHCCAQASIGWWTWTRSPAARANPS